MIARACRAQLIAALLFGSCTSFTVGNSPPIRLAPPPSAEEGRACYEACLDRAARANQDASDCAERCYP